MKTYGEWCLLQYDFPQRREEGAAEKRGAIVQGNQFLARNDLQQKPQTCRFWNAIGTTKYMEYSQRSPINVGRSKDLWTAGSDAILQLWIHFGLPIFDVYTLSLARVPTLNTGIYEYVAIFDVRNNNVGFFAT